jgi:hypothetical protein
MKPEQICKTTAMLLVAGTCLLTGCASIDTGRLTRLTVEVVDEGNSRPVPDVSALWREDIDDLMLGHFQIGPTNLQPSDDAGIIKIFPVRKGMVGSLTLSRPDGFTLYCVYVSGQLGYSRAIDATTPDGEFLLSNPIREAVWTNGYFVVPMPKTK